MEERHPRVIGLLTLDYSTESEERGGNCVPPARGSLTLPCAAQLSSACPRDVGGWLVGW